MKRAELQQLAEDRLQDAEVLLAAGRWTAAYYLAGYAVECGLKACVLAHLEQVGMLFEDKKQMKNLIDDYFTHEIDRLVDLAELEVDRGLAIAGNAAMGDNWNIVKDWKESSRYKQASPAQAQALIHAITDVANGVMPWIKAHW